MPPQVQVDIGSTLQLRDGRFPAFGRFDEGLSIRVPTPLGVRLELRTNGLAITASAFTARRVTKPPAQLHPLLSEAIRQVRAYFGRRLRRFNLPLKLEGTTLQIAVWQLVSGLEFGELISYADVARAVGRPGTHRAVAAAMRATPLDLLIPAHRVIGSDGRLHGAAPRSLRRRLLALEGIVLP